MFSLSVLRYMRGLCILLVLTVVSVCPLVVYAGDEGSKFVQVIGKSNPFANRLYDASIKKWSAIYTPEIPWYWNKAQLIAESALNPNAVSAVGAGGLGQFMPDTWKEMEHQLNFKGSVFNPALNIQSQTYYMGKLLSQFKKDRPIYDKYSLALASYNAGLGNVLEAQKKGGNSLMYEPMAKALPKVTGVHSKETTDYVQRIWDYIDVLINIEGD